MVKVKDLLGFTVYLSLVWSKIWFVSCVSLLNAICATEKRSTVLIVSLSLKSQCGKEVQVCSVFHVCLLSVVQR